MTSRFLTALFFILSLNAVALGQNAEPSPEATVSSPTTSPESESSWSKAKKKTQEVYKDTTDYSGKKLHEANDAVKETLNEIPLQRAARPWTAAVNATVFETWVINKFGLTLSYADSAADVYEVEYLTGSLGLGKFGLDVGKIDEQKVSVLWRSYNQRSTFSFFTGLSYNIFAVHLGNEYLATVTGSQYADADLLRISTVAATWGFGQRWHTKNGTVWGVDWLNLSIPLFLVGESTPFTEVSNDPNKRRDVSDAAKVFKRLPSFGVLKLQIGYSF